MNTSKKRIMIIAHANRHSGGQSAGTNLLKNFRAYADEFDFLAVLPARCGYEDIVSGHSIHVVWFSQDGNLFKRFFFDCIGLRRIAAHFKPDIILCMGHVGYPWLGGRQFIRFADPNFVYSKRFHGKLTLWQRMRYVILFHQLRWSLRTARIVYCQTETMSDRLRQYFEVNAQIKVLPNCLPIDSTCCGDGDAVPAAIQEREGKFRLFCLARYYPHKNLERIVDVFSKYRQELMDVVVYLTIDADQHRGAKRLLRRIKTEGLDQMVVNVGPISQRDIGSYFRNCHGLLFPTLLESFSASYLEAMYFGLPIITSDVDFARDVCGDAAIYCKPIWRKGAGSGSGVFIALRGRRMLQ